MANAIYLPRLKSIRVQDFSLYTNIPTFEVDLNKNVTCIAGANGLGKSTFLNIVAFALTGVVRNHDQQYKGIYEIRRMNYSEQYFKGRVSQLDVETAAVELVFFINTTQIKVTRSFKNGGELISFSANGAAPVAEENAYEELVARLTGVGSFEQFLFLVHFVMIFDESRETLFWNSNILTTTLNILLGLDPAEAKIADDYTKQINKYSSLFRNTSYQISKTREVVAHLKRSTDEMDSFEESNSIELLSEYDKLFDTVESLVGNVSNLEIQRRSIVGLIGELSGKKHDLDKKYRDQYEFIFGNNSGKTRIRHHEIVQSLLEDGSCKICGTSDVEIKAIIEALENSRCPLCHSSFKNTNEELEIEKLKELDIEIARLSRLIDEKHIEKDQVENALIETRNRIQCADNRIKEIENSPTYYRSKRKSAFQENGLKDAIESNEKVIQGLENKKEEHRIARDKYIKEAEKLRRKTLNKYKSIESAFIPIFVNLAYKFIGIDINLRLETTSTYNRPEFRFILELGDSDRLDSHQLSESQRFFIDIAFRMALIDLIKKDTDLGGVLLLDTPEGSLDIAYEINAGDMLSSFALNGNQLFMTANINSSGVLTELSNSMSTQTMNLVRMIQWVQLSAVQIQQITKIEAVFDALEQRLGGCYE